MVGSKNIHPHKNSLLSRLDTFDFLFMQTLRISLSSGYSQSASPLDSVKKGEAL
jgi:hypothetical protein